MAFVRGTNMERFDIMQARIIIADEYPVVLFGAEDALVRAGLQVALTTSKPAQLPSLLTVVSCSVLIIDPFQSGEFFAAGMKLLDNVRRLDQNMRLIVFTESCSERLVRELVGRGIHGLVCKGDGTADLVAAVRSVAMGESFVSPSAAKHLPGSTLQPTDGWGAIRF